MRGFITFLCLLSLAVVAFAFENADVSPVAGPVVPKNEIDNPWDLMFYFNCQQSFSPLQLSAAHAGGYFWVASGGSVSTLPEDNKYYRFNNAGVLVDSFAQPLNSGWGWRDLAFDGTYLYAGCEVAQIVAFDPTTGALVPTMDFPKPSALAVCRALAYDPATDHFWSGNFASNMMEFDRSGTIIWQGSPSPLTGVYGMAWDGQYSAGPTLWVCDQTNSNSATFWRFNPVTHTMTTESHAVPPIPGLTSQIAGGAELSTDYLPGAKVMVGVVQGTPFDVVYVLEYSGEPFFMIDVSLTPENPPIVIPAQGGSFNFTASVVHMGPAQTPFVVWARIKNPDGTYTAPTLGPVTVNPPLGQTISRQRTQNVPGSWPPGQYTYLGYANMSFSYPALDSSYFIWTKSATSNSGRMVWDSNCYGELFPGEPSQRASIPSGLDLSASPNPFNPTTALSYQLQATSQVSMKVYDTAGRLVGTLVDGMEEAGQHSITFDGSNLASGVYLATLTTKGHTVTAKLMLIK